MSGYQPIVRAKRVTLYENRDGRTFSSMEDAYLRAAIVRMDHGEGDPPPSVRRLWARCKAMTSDGHSWLALEHWDRVRDRLVSLLAHWDRANTDEEPIW